MLTVKTPAETLDIITDQFHCLATQELSLIHIFDITGHWAEAYIRNLTSLGVITGYTDNTFRPEKNISRAEMVSLIYRTYLLLYPNEAGMTDLGLPQYPPVVTESPFIDVYKRQTQYYFDYEVQDYPAIVAINERNINVLWSDYNWLFRVWSSLELEEIFRIAESITFQEELFQ